MITGSRKWTDEEAIEQYLKWYHAPTTTLIHGAAKGADLLAARIGRRLGFKIEAYPADWKRQPDGTYDKGAGLKRNQDMVNSLTPGVDEVLAFNLNNSHGTADAIRRANKRGIKITEVIHITNAEGEVIQRYCTEVVNMDWDDLLTEILKGGGKR
jgi:hypothetical protein